MARTRITESTRWGRVARIVAFALVAVSCGGASETTDSLTQPATVAPTAQPSPVPPTPEPPSPEPTATRTATPSAVSEPTPAAAMPTPIPSPIPTVVPLRGDVECQLDQTPPGPVGATALDVEIVAQNLEVPWGLVVLPSGNLLVTERSGRLRLVRDGDLVDEPLLEIDISEFEPLFNSDRLGFEGGLLGLLLHPDFKTNRLFYLYVNVANTNGENIGQIQRYVLAEDELRVAFDRVILDEIPTGIHHQGGRMKIGPDGMLYVGVGAFDPFEAQNPDSLAGKLLRVDLDGGIPADNPVPGSYVFVSGIRNSQGFDWYDDDHIVMVDHGPSGLELDRPDLRGFDEVNVVTAGDNLGWPLVWGCDKADGLTSPSLTWSASVPPTGAVLYRGNEIPEWTNSFLFTTVGGDFGQHLHRVELDQTDPRVVTSHEIYLLRQYGRLRTIVEAPDGSLYMMTSNCDNRGVCPARKDIILRVRVG